MGSLENPCSHLSACVCAGEKQESALCATHCLNALLQGPYFSEVDMANIASVPRHGLAHNTRTSSGISVWVLIFPFLSLLCCVFDWRRHALDERERALMAEGEGTDSSSYLSYMSQDSSNVDESGNFSIEVLSSCLKNMNLECVNLSSPECKDIRAGGLVHQQGQPRERSNMDTRTKRQGTQRAKRIGCLFTHRSDVLCVCVQASFAIKAPTG